MKPLTLLFVAMFPNTNAEFGNEDDFCVYELEEDYQYDPCYDEFDAPEEI